MTIDEIKIAYRMHATAHGKATMTGDYKAANRSHDELVALVPVMRSFGEAGTAALRELTEDADEAVVCWSATHLLASDEGKALGALEPLARKPGPIGFNAKMVIQQWKKGELPLP
ncbi:hypothetical protein JIN84_04680 [Luteolibacter yonseiensis]|uniref:DUF2019 domain-containing protein n=1 Tax=Luteolibacter yonseiensis TaxID=1144680 RepID=A0A934V992_9BACT|nr:hypothetical protein [Luteolibacter yonseiensis]MBK1814898.1 hypothetical protein [Luteolibacter yonseiensis]